jgi:hypothetical protein
MSTPVYEGGCQCGAVRYRAQGEPSSVEYCHCSMCRRSAGAPVVVWATFPSADVTFPAGRPRRYASSAGAQRGFCARCGTQLTFQSDDQPEQIDLTVGSLDAPERLPPRHHLFEADRVPWLELADGLPRYPKRRPRM